MKRTRPAIVPVLAIAPQNARLHDGDIAATDTGNGARFTLRLPRHPEKP